jgi:SAM-dependent methyltransferase
MMRVLHVGCGITPVPPVWFPKPEWAETRLDIDPGVEPDVVAPLTALPVADGAMQAVYSSHNVEHLHPDDVHIALSEFYRVLAPGGFAIVTVPNLGAAAALVAADQGEVPVYVSPAGPITPMDIVFGHAGMRRHNPFMAHQTGFTEKSLRKAMELAGFRVVVMTTDAEIMALWCLGVRDGDCA